MGLYQTQKKLKKKIYIQTRNLSKITTSNGSLQNINKTLNKNGSLKTRTNRQNKHWVTWVTPKYQTKQKYKQWIPAKKKKKKKITA
jgi:hypothetical protein